MTPKRAVAIGTCAITLPVLAIMSLGVLLSVELLTSWFVLAGAILSIVTAWFYWSLAVPVWRIWASGSDIDPDQLQTLAQRAGLIWKRASIFDKTEIKVCDKEP